MPDEEYTEVPLDALKLDPENPRLPRDADWATAPESQMLREFARRYNLIELARSIADKGFTPRHAEALLVVEDQANRGSYVVIEGNRRFATLKLLLSAALRRGAGLAGGEWDDLAEQAADKVLDPVPVIVYPTRDALDDYLGFRHITGPTPWRPEAKARFIAKLLAENVEVGEVAKHIGTNHRTVRRYAEAHAIYTQAIGAGIPMGEVEAGFGVFYNALDRQGIRDYLGLGRQVDILTLPDAPVPAQAMDNLRELIGLLYGDKERELEKVIVESRELRKLDKVLANERARANLLRDRDLDRAWRVSGGGREDLLALLTDLHSRLAEVSGQAPEYREDEEVRADIRRIHVLVSDMAERYQVDES
ncbi:MAG: hypothetical protein OXI51_01125 [Chloroflexota bacterium]|nr:hypothetical protein [Chloroflexota bacterium]